MLHLLNQIKSDQRKQKLIGNELNLMPIILNNSLYYLCIQVRIRLFLSNGEQQYLH